VRQQYPSRWIQRPELDGVQWVHGGWYEEGERTPETAYGMVIDHMQLNMLINYLHEHGYIKPQLSENRTEDTKIINRLIDTLQQAIPRAGGAA
jgi:hypothetical protein